MKKQLFLFLMMLLPLAASADAVEIDGFYYNLVLKAKVAEVTSNPNENKYRGAVEIPETVTYDGVIYNVNSIGVSAFRGCTDLTSVIIPNSVTSIGRGAFYGCSSLKSVTIPNSVTSIDGSAFYECSGLTSVTIPNSVTSIGGSTFYGCSSLTSVNIPNSLTSIEYRTFYGCSSLTSVIIGNSVTNIDGSAFYSCSRLRSVNIPNSVTSIGFRAFRGCSSLTSVTIGNSVTSIGDEAFIGCSGLTSVNIPNSVIDIGQYAFYDCSGLTSVSISNSVTSIGASAFAGCSGLTRVTIGNSVTRIGNGAFQNCPKLLDLNCYAANVPRTDASAFNDSYIEYVTLYVPESALEEYKTTAPWSGFKDYVTLPNYKLTYIVDGEVYKTYKYEEDRKVPIEKAPEKEGYTFSGWSEIPETMPAHDVTVTGSFEKIIVVKCATPAIAFKDGKFKFESEDEGVEFVWSFNIVNSNGKGSEAGAPTKFAVSVYATKENYEDSDVATMEMDMRSVIGDVSGDGKVDATDLTKLIDILLKQ